MSAGDVALLMSVTPRAVNGWADDGKIESVRTPGGHRRIPAEVVRKLLEGAS
jgi:excisionase family DNA binding protein